MPHHAQGDVLRSSPVAQAIAGSLDLDKFPKMDINENIKKNKNKKKDKRSPRVMLHAVMVPVVSKQWKQEPRGYTIMCMACSKI